MFLETECGICYRTYNAGLRCPRQLSCKHTFCERCLATLAQSNEIPDPRIQCPLCRTITSLSDATIKDKLPVNEDILERLVKAASLEGLADDDEEFEEPNQDATCPRKEESSPPRTPRGRLMRSIRRLCKKIIGDDRTNCMTDEDLRDLAMMSCYMT
ncbi:RING finger protein 227 [Paramisgurnus dabryanus]|uniref:RING finger protein 227 n=1 Tax=Paramisgurnus dabryanus TaxID=90735 RepID=UPI0031F389B7